jgi:UDP-N-acetylmuramate--alanine ligase
MMSEFIHFVGIGGIGVSALAQVAQARGAQISGSDSHADAAANPALARLIAGGATIYVDHRREHVASGVTLLVATAAVGDDNPEIAVAREREIRVVSRAAYLGELMAAHRGTTIAVAGTHGKTTTTGMIGVMLEHAGLDPTVFVGGEVEQLGGNVRVGSADGPFVAEACEAYDSFLHLHADIAVVTNVEADHLDHYGSEAGVFAAFAQFLSGLRERGTIVACGDDGGIRRLFGQLETNLRDRTRYYGVEDPGATVVARSLELGERPSFILFGPQLETGTSVRLGVPGLHNVENALAAAAVGIELNVSPETIATGLGIFRGAGRRQDLVGTIEVGRGQAIVIDDYAHHPTEIRATLEALRSAHPGRRLVAIFQPHLYSRTRDFLGEFARTLADADVLVVTDIYAARENPIEGVHAAHIADIARSESPGIDARYVADKREIPSLLRTILQPDDLVVFMGAGDIREEADALVAGRMLEAVR